MTAAQRLGVLLQLYPYQDDGSSVTELSEVILLVQANRYDGSPWLTTHLTLEDAAEYLAFEEYPEDWRFVGVWDLSTGDRYELEYRLEKVNRLEKVKA